MLIASPVAKVRSDSSETISPDSIPTRASQLELAHVLEDGDTGADGAHRIVLMRLRNAESDHDRVAGVAPHRAAVGLDAALDALEEALHARARNLRIRSSDKGSRVDQVDEHDRCQLPLHPSSLRTNRECPELPFSEAVSAP